MIIAFSFLSLLNDDYKSAIKTFNDLTDDWIHFDVMDGEFVMNSTFNHELVKTINEYNHLFSDVHLMISNPSDVISEYSKIGVNQLTFHYEAVNKADIFKVIETTEGLLLM